MNFTARHPVSAEYEDSVYACGRCGAELIRTSMRKASKPEPSKTSEAA
ncbi:MAG: hypothetical protein WAM75_17000 [Xanthobacteraceae bacterium]